MLSGTEAEILKSVARLGKATKGQISREIVFSLYYVGFLCRYLVRKGYLIFSEGHYSLAVKGITTLLEEEKPKSGRQLLKGIAHEIAKEISVTLKALKREAIKIEIPSTQIKGREKERGEQIKIKTDFDLPVEDESVALESNINKIGVKLEKDKSDIDESVRLFRKIRKEGREDD